ncbi:MAG: DNA cytosine methyltransferase, partial [Pikeienuella sp.]
MPGFYEFFAGGGMVRAGLGPGWDCLFANDFDAGKAAAYRANWGGADFRLADIGTLSAADLPGRADLMWGSSPCQDLSLAGGGAGLAGARSGAFFAFARILGELVEEGRAPRFVAIENVTGLLTSRGGADFAAVAGRFAALGYRWGAMVADAALFLPQSRPRLFVIGAHESLDLSAAPLAAGPEAPFHPEGLIRAVERLPAALREEALWWAQPAPATRNFDLIDLIEPDPPAWRSDEETARLLSLMAPLHRARVEAAQRAGRPAVGCVYRRTRRDASGARK